MKTSKLHELYNIGSFRKESGDLLKNINKLRKIENVRSVLIKRITEIFRSKTEKYPPAHELIRMRDCSLVLLNAFSDKSEWRSGFSLVKAIWDISKNKSRDDLTPAFYAEMINWIRGLEGRAEFQFIHSPTEVNDNLTGRDKAVNRSNELDIIWTAVNERMNAYPNGLSPEAIHTRKKRKNRIMNFFNVGEEEWKNWKWHVRNIIKDKNALSKLIDIDDSKLDTINKALKNRLPFGITPYYMSLMDDIPGLNDIAIRYQVLPPEDYVDEMIAHKDNRDSYFDFMLETDTSPHDRITRRYPGIVILKPVSTCPQICVYCQRNWEIDEVMAPRSFATKSDINSSIKWIKKHPSIREVLITGGDPFIMSDNQIQYLLESLSGIDHIDLIRFGTRTPVTLPMRITDELCDLLGSYREVGRRDIAVMTHVEHPYEVTKDTAVAIDRLKRQGISVYNQHVYTFYVSRRFEATLLRILLRRIGIDPYYTFMPKGKEETNAYRVPLARILQEQKEEARLVPGLRRTDEAVFNVPGLGKNYLRALQHRDLLTVLPDGKRLYEFHPWDLNLTRCQTYLYEDISILNYLRRLESIGEKIEDYDSIWFFI